MRKVLLQTLALLALASPVGAQDKIETSDNEFYVQSQGGAPAICGFDIHLSYLDRTYLKGQLAGVSATLGWTEARGNIAVLFKLIGIDFPNIARMDPKPKAYRVHQAYLSSGGRNFMPDKTFPCEEQSSFCSTYWLPQSVDIYTHLLTDKLSINFSRTPNGLDVSLPLDTDATTKANPESLRTFIGCISALIDRAKANLPR